MMDDLKTVTYSLKQIRRSYKIPQKQIAYYMGVSQSAISQFEAGKIDSYTMIIKYDHCLKQIIEDIRS